MDLLLKVCLCCRLWASLLHYSSLQLYLHCQRELDIHAASSLHNSSRKNDLGLSGLSEVTLTMFLLLLFIIRKSLMVHLFVCKAMNMKSL